MTALSPRSFLLTAVALLSSYSIHLLLKSSGIVGECNAMPPATPVSPPSPHPCVPIPQASVPMSSWVSEPSAHRASWLQPLPSHCRTLEVSARDGMWRGHGDTWQPPTTLPSSARSHVQLPVHCQVRGATGHPDLPQPGGEDHVSVTHPILLPPSPCPTHALDSTPAVQPLAGINGIKATAIFDHCQC